MSGDLAYLYIIPSLLALLLMIIEGFINPFNGVSLYLPSFAVLLPLTMFWCNGNLTVKYVDMAHCY